jgi:putative transposase
MKLNRRKHIRWRKWKYGSAASYFVTVCCRDHQEFFGEITDDVMYKNELGQIVEEEWLLSKTLRPDMNITLGEFVVMPDHFHGIVTIGKNPFNHLDQNKYGP